MTAQQRRAMGNAIWLCQTCAKWIDSDISCFTIQVLRDWRKAAESETRLELSNGRRASTLGPPDAAHSIRFAVEDWQIWRERGTLPDDPFVIIHGWRRGDVRYAFRLRFRNELAEEDQIKRLRVEFHADSEILCSDEYAIQPDEIVLPSRKWITREIVYGLYDESIFFAATSVWVSAQGVGDNESFSWHIADYNPNTVSPPADE
jgi:hypothetical protein